MKHIKSFYSIFLAIFVFSSHIAWAENAPTFQYEEVVVSSNKYYRPSWQNPWSSSLIDSKIISNFPVDTIAETMVFAPAIDLKRNGGIGAVSTARVRGGTSQQTSVLIDGQDINSPLLGTTDLGDLIIDAFGTIKITRAPLSSAYAADAAAGAIDIKTQEKLPGLPNTVDIKFGDFNTQKCAFHAGFNMPDITLSANAARISSNGYRDNSSSDMQNFIVRLELPRGKDVYSFKAIRILSYKGVPGVPQSDLQPYSASTPGDWQRDNNGYMAFGWQRSLAPFTSVKADLFMNNMQQNWHGYDFSRSVFEDAEYLAAESGLDMQYEHVAYDSMKFCGGIKYKSAYGSNKYVGDKSVQNVSLYVNEEIGLNTPVNMNIGIRADKHSASGNSINPRVGVLYFINNYLGIKSSLSSGLRTPTLNDLYWYDPVWQMYGNPNLRPERTASFDLGMIYKLGHSSEIQLTGFVLEATDLIAWDWDISTNITRAKNINASNSQGFEVEFHNRMNLNTFTFINMTLQKVEDIKDINPQYIGKRIPYSPDFKYSAGFSWQNDNGLQFGVVLRGVGPRYADGANTIKLKSFNVINAQISQKIDAARLVLAIDNLTNEQYYESVGYHPVSYQVLGYPMPGRALSLSYQAAF